MHLTPFLYVIGDYGKQQIEAGSSYRVTANNNINVAMILKDVYDETRKFFIIIPPHTTSTIQQTVYIPLNTGSIMSEFAGTKMQSYYVHNSSTSSASARETVNPDMVASHNYTFDSVKYYTVSIVFNAQNRWVVFPGPRHFNRATEQVSNHTFVKREVKSMQRLGTEAIRPKIQPSKPKQEITKTTNSKKEITYGQPSEQLFSKRWPLSPPLSNQNRTKDNMNANVCV